MEVIISEFIAKYLHYLHIPFHTISSPPPHPETDCTWLDLGLRQLLPGREDFYKKAFNAVLHSATNTIYYVRDQFHFEYVYCRFPEKQAWAIIGPVLFDTIDDSRFQVLTANIPLQEQEKELLWLHYHRVTVLDGRKILESIVSLAADHLFGKGQFRIVYYGDNARNTLRWTDQSHILSYTPFFSIRNIESRYTLFQHLFLAVSKGDEKKALKLFRQLNDLSLPSRLDDQLQDRKYQYAVDEAAIKQAAAQAGVHYAHLEAQSNYFLRQLDKLDTMEECQQMMEAMIHSYCNMVMNLNLKDYSSPIRHVVTYITANISADLNLHTLAEQVNLNPNYLSTLFKREVGSSLTDFINRNRISIGQHLLQNTDLPIKVIAQECGFSNLNYFSRLFQRITGITPTAYRKQQSLFN